MNPDFTKGNGLLPVIIQDVINRQVLMLGYMNPEAFQLTRKTGKVTFYSRSKKRIWVKGESSGNYLRVKRILEDCDRDSLLILAEPAGPTCHTGALSCFDACMDKSSNPGIDPGLEDPSASGFLYRLESIINERIIAGQESSYTFRLFQKGINKIAQKVGEEAVELVIEAKDEDPGLFKNEAADLLYHFLILLKAKAISLRQIETVLKSRNT